MDTIKLLLDELQSNDKMIETLQQRQKLLHSKLGIALSESRSVSVEDADTDTEGEEDEQEVVFDDNELTMSWNGGIIHFRKTRKEGGKTGGDKLYLFCKTVWQSGSDGIEQSELALILHGDELASIKHLLSASRRRLRNNGFFADLENDGKRISFS